MDKFGPIPLESATLERRAELRENAPAMAQLQRGDRARFLLWHRGRVVTVNEGIYISDGPPVRFAEFSSKAVFLGLSEDIAYFIIPLPKGAILPEGLGAADPRYLLGHITPLQGALLSVACGVLNWQEGHRFCGLCGAPTRITASGWQIRCSGCGKEHYPRTDPVVIMLITRNDRLLIGRSPGWPDGVYSLLAGFIEPGETVEQAVRREAFEEVGIACGEVQYIASQPWPFPGSLMIGCHTEALASHITRDPAEIEDAVWVTREEVRAILANEHGAINPPGRGAIAALMMQYWLAD